MSTAVEHVALRPGWACGACEAEWPCAPAKVQLAEEYDTNEGALLEFLALCMWEAFYDGLGEPAQRRHPIPPSLRERFLVWVVLPLVSGRPAPRNARCTRPPADVN